MLSSGAESKRPLRKKIGPSRSHHLQNTSPGQEKLSTQIHWVQTLSSSPHISLKKEQLRYKRKHVKRSPALILAVDCSASAMVGAALHHVKGALDTLLKTAYLERRSTALIRFSGQRVDTLIPLGKPQKDYRSVLASIRGGGGTPLDLAFKHINTLCKHHQRQSLTQAQLMLFTDGRSPTPTISLSSPALIIDTEYHRIPLQRCKLLASQMGADYIHLRDLPTV
ncbi:MAG: VWA domain-containing protein [Gammaproteobacteria bacterium]|nr:VWA domain-containing protein [Gammaproteobacteria bacterium]